MGGGGGWGAKHIYSKVSLSGAGASVSMVATLPISAVLLLRSTGLKMASLSLEHTPGYRMEMFC